MNANGSAIETDGRVWFRNALSEGELLELDRVGGTGQLPGVRLDLSTLHVAIAPVDRLARALLPGARPVRVVAFNKSESANWSLPWHQDRVIAVRERVDVAGFGNWTRKSGVWHVEPPIGLLQRMVFARVHLDPANSENGCMEIAPGSHKLGRVVEADAHVAATQGSLSAELCIAGRGDVLFVKALTLHRSRASQDAGSRRALWIDYSSEALPPPLEWEFSP